VLVTVGPVGARRVVPCGACWADVYDNNHEEMQACEATWTPGRGAGVRKGVGFKSLRHARYQLISSVWAAPSSIRFQTAVQSTCNSEPTGEQYLLIVSTSSPSLIG
jgi:hypothetical protein